MKRGKKYKKIAEEVKKAQKPKDLLTAVQAVKKYSITKFGGSIDIHIATKSKEREYTVRGVVSFPNTFGKRKKILVFCDEKDKEKALSAGADFAGVTELITKIQEGWMDFDIVLAVPQVMRQIAVLGKILGPKGMMPNPKDGTIINSLNAIKEFKGGKTAYKTDKNGVIHVSVGKFTNKEVPQEDEKIVENIKALISSVREACAKSNAQIKAIHIAPTMGPSIEITTLV